MGEVDEVDDAFWELVDSLPTEVSCTFCPTELDRGDTKTCCECERPLCGDCSGEILTEIFCPDCKICRICGSEAIFACEKCSLLICGEHTMERVYRELDTGYTDKTLVCSRCFDEGRN